MKKVLTALYFISFFGFSSLQAKPQQVSDQQIRSLVLEYYKVSHAKDLSLRSSFVTPFDAPSFTRPRPPECDEDQNRPDTSCIDLVCNRMPSHYCDDQSEIDRVIGICRGVNRPSCIKDMCDKMPSHYCDDYSELERVSGMCRGHVSGQCVTIVCSKMPSHYCDDYSELERVGRMCQNTDENCIQSVCSRLPAHNCDDYAELEKVAATCAGRR